MLAALAEHRDEEVGGAVGDQMLFGEIRGRGDEDGDLDEPADLFEVAERGLGLRQDIDGAELRAPRWPAAVSTSRPSSPAAASLPSFERQLAGGEEQMRRFCANGT